MTPSEWLADIGKAAEELGYGITELTPFRISLVERQGDAEITIESRMLSGDFLRRHLILIPHRSGTSYSRAYEETVRRP